MLAASAALQKAEEAEHGRVALAQLGQSRLGLIPLDPMMPGMEELAFLAELRRHDQWRTIPVIVAMAKDITAEDRAPLRLGQTIVQQGASSREELLSGVGDVTAACHGRAQPFKPVPLP